MTLFDPSSKLSLTRVPGLTIAALLVAVGALGILWFSILALDERGGTVAGASAASAALVITLIVAILVTIREPSGDGSEQALRTFRAFSNASPSANVIVRRDHTIAEWNNAASEIFNVPAATALNRTTDDVLAAPLSNAAAAAIDRAFESQRAFPIEATYPADGLEKTILGTIFPIQVAAGEQAVGAVLWDTTELNNRQRATGNLRNMLDAIINSAAEGIIGTDADGRIVTFNRGAERMFGLSATDAVGQSIDAFIPEIHGERVTEFVGTGERKTIEATASRVDGATFIARGGIAGVEFDGGRMLALVLRDASAAIAQQREIDQARMAAEEANAAKTEFLSRMSHELRTPLNVMLGFAQVMQLDRSLGPQHEDNLAHIMRAGHHLVQLIDDVLDISRIEAGRLSLSVEPVALRDVVDSVLDLMRPAAAERKVLLSVAGLAPTLFVQADRNRLRQVLLNLVSNAVKYNVPGGSVVITATEEDARVVTHIRDTGRGIAQERITRVFEPFDRLGAEMTEIEGTGLGLALSKALVEAMGGTIRVESTPGAGSTFSMDLPAAEPERPEQLERQRLVVGAPHAMEGRTVLYIEDNLANLALVERILEIAGGARLVSAMQGSVGLELALAQLPDVILLDLHLPDISGEDVLVRLAQHEETRYIPVIVTSADASPGRVARLLEMGAHAYLTKPLDVPQFLATIDDVIKRTDGSGNAG